jgi:hypothetical protein
MKTRITELFGIQHPVVLAPWAASQVGRWRPRSREAAGWA